VLWLSSRFSEQEVLIGSMRIDKLVGALIEPMCVQPTFLIHHPGWYHSLYVGRHVAYNSCFECVHAECMSPLAKSHSSIAGVTRKI
jgi:lysyl-tRNA synthetase class II